MEGSLKNLSSLGQSAVALDRDFAELDNLSGQLERTSFLSEEGMTRAKRLLGKFGECGLRVGDGVQKLARALDEARARAEQAATLVAQQAALIVERQTLSNGLNDRYGALRETVAVMTASIGQHRKSADEPLGPEEKTRFIEAVPDICEQISKLIADAALLKKEASDVNMKEIVRASHAMSQRLHVARNKLSSLITAH